MFSKASWENLLAVVSGFQVVEPRIKEICYSTCTVINSMKCNKRLPDKAGVMWAIRIGKMYILSYVYLPETVNYWSSLPWEQCCALPGGRVVNDATAKACSKDVSTPLFSRLAILTLICSTAACTEHGNVDGVFYLILYLCPPIELLSKRTDYTVRRSKTQHTTGSFCW